MDLQKARLTTIIDPDDITVLHNDYDSYSRVTSQTDGRGNVTGFSCDLNNRQTTVTDAVYKATAIEYDEKYRSTSVTYTGNITESFTYDNNNCRTSITDGRGATPPPITMTPSATSLTLPTPPETPQQ